MTALEEIKNCVIIGAGNLATQTALYLQKKGVEIKQIYSRTENSAKALANQLSCPFTIDTDKIIPDGELYIYAVKDDILPELISRIKTTAGIHVHTAGSVPMSVFEGHRQHYGVLYPLQTFSKTKPVDFSAIPIFIEANSSDLLQRLKSFAEKLSPKVEYCTTEQRQSLHLAAVFCCNFSNHLYHLADLILKQNQLPFEVVLPLINETTEKLQTLSPAQAQTGPAMRYDTGIINKHLSALASMSDAQQIYKQISDSIHRQATH